jgi:hypothetical protein
MQEAAKGTRRLPNIRQHCEPPSLINGAAQLRASLLASQCRVTAIFGSDRFAMFNKIGTARDAGRTPLKVKPMI